MRGVWRSMLLTLIMTLAFEQLEAFLGGTVYQQQPPSNPETARATYRILKHDVEDTKENNEQPRLREIDPNQGTLVRHLSQTQPGL